MAGEGAKEQDATEDKVCGFDKQPCIKHRCVHYQMLTGQHFQTGEKIRRWDCAFNADHLMLGEHSAEARNVSADVHALKQNMNVFVETLLHAAGRPDLLEHMKARISHINALTRTEELRERNRRQHAAETDDLPCEQ